MTNRRHSIFFSLAMVCLFVTLLILWDTLSSAHLSYRLPFISYGGTFRWHYLKIGTRKLSLYWSAHLAGVILMCEMCVRRRHQCDLDIKKAISTGILLAVFGYLGAKLLFLIENGERILQDQLPVGLGGVSFFGTVFLMPAVIPPIGRAMKTDPWAYLDFCTPAGILMLACIRLGCFMRGCCGGLRIWAAGNPLIFPTQLMECALDLLLLDLILGLERDGRFQRCRYLIFMGRYGCIRFFLEFLRSTPKTCLFLSNGQWFSLICIGISFLASIQKKTARGTDIH